MKTIGILILAMLSTAAMAQTKGHVPNVDGYRAPMVDKPSSGLNASNVPVRGPQECLQRKADHTIVCHTRVEWEQIAQKLSAKTSDGQ